MCAWGRMAGKAKAGIAESGLVSWPSQNTGLGVPGTGEDLQTGEQGAVRTDTVNNSIRMDGIRLWQHQHLDQCSSNFKVPENHQGPC